MFYVFGKLTSKRQPEHGLGCQNLVEEVDTNLGDAYVPLVTSQRVPTSRLMRFSATVLQKLSAQKKAKMDFWPS